MLHRPVGDRRPVGVAVGVGGVRRARERAEKRAEAECDPVVVQDGARATRNDELQQSRAAESIPQPGPCQSTDLILGDVNCEDASQQLLRRPSAQRGDGRRRGGLSCKLASAAPARAAAIQVAGSGTSVVTARPSVRQYGR